jgi:cytochrome oxidase Cu insertion factor (SCO1/SenC/PrrC family)
VSETLPGIDVDALRSAGKGHELAALLPERLPAYAGRSATEMNHLRGYVLAAFAETGLPDEALPYVLEALESGHDAYEVAGAAIGLRGRATLEPEAGALLERAVERLAGADVTVSFESYDPVWPYREPTTALTELVRTIGHFGTATTRLEGMAQQAQRFSGAVREEMRRALSAAAPPSCCAAMPHHEEPSEAVLAAPIELEDQDGRSTDAGTVFTGRPSVVAFFYTRCDNPYKCSMTITKLGAVQELLTRQGLAEAVTVAAITYDPSFDVPMRLRRYGADRGFRFDERARFFRTTSGFTDLRQHFALGVNFGASTVNRHQIEVHVLDARGRVAASFTRRRWEVEAVADAVRILCEPSSQNPGVVTLP